MDCGLKNTPRISAITNWTCNTWRAGSLQERIDTFRDLSLLTYFTVHGCGVRYLKKDILCLYYKYSIRENCFYIKFLLF